MESNNLYIRKTSGLDILLMRGVHEALKDLHDTSYFYFKRDFHSSPENDIEFNANNWNYYAKDCKVKLTLRL